MLDELSDEELERRIVETLRGVADGTIPVFYNAGDLAADVRRRLGEEG